VSRTRGRIEVREAHPEEYEEIGALTAAAYQGYPEAGEDADYMAELRDVAARATVRPVLVAVDVEGRLMGSVMYVDGPGPFAETEGENEASFRMLVVADWARGRGAGEALTRACIDRARAGGRSALVLLTLPAMTAAHRLYEKLGFRRSPERDWEFEPGRRLLGYEHDLSARV
jgi:ribosomal protein S18 acetylase RimI-like enzyme